MLSHFLVLPCGWSSSVFAGVDLQAVPEKEDREGCPRDGWHRRKAQADVSEMES